VSNAGAREEVPNMLSRTMSCDERLMFQVFQSNPATAALIHDRVEKSRAHEPRQ